LTFPDLHLDITFFALVLIAGFAFFGPPFVVKTLDFWGFKAEFGTSPAAPQANPRPEELPTELRPKLLAELSPDTMLARTMKLTPTEAIIGYVLTISMFRSPRMFSIVSASAAVSIEWIFVVVFAIMALAFALVQRVGARQATAATLIFVAWAFALGGPFTTLSWYDPVYGALALAIVSFGLPFAF
jgi:hypothetical protein